MRKTDKLKDVKALNIWAKANCDEDTQLAIARIISRRLTDLEKEHADKTTHIEVVYEEVPIKKPHRYVLVDAKTKRELGGYS